MTGQRYLDKTIVYDISEPNRDRAEKPEGAQDALSPLRMTNSLQFLLGLDDCFDYYRSDSWRAELKPTFQVG